MNLRNTASETEKGLRNLRLVGVGRKYTEQRLAEMQKKKETSETSVPQISEVKPKK